MTITVIYANTRNSRCSTVHALPMCNKDTLIAKQHLPSDSTLPNDPLQYVLPAAFVPPPSPV